MLLCGKKKLILIFHLFEWFFRNKFQIFYIVFWENGEQIVSYNTAYIFYQLTHNYIYHVSFMIVSKQDATISLWNKFNHLPWIISVGYLLLEVPRLSAAPDHVYDCDKDDNKNRHGK